MDDVQGDAHCSAMLAPPFAAGYQRRIRIIARNAHIFVGLQLFPSLRSTQSGRSRDEKNYKFPASTTGATSVLSSEICEGVLDALSVYLNYSGFDVS